MGCEETRDLLPLYAGGDLPRDVAAGLEAHTASCAECARELELFREALAQVGCLREDERAEPDWKTMSAAVRADLFPRRPVRLFDEVLRFAAVLMVGLAVGVGAYTMTRPARLPGPTEVAGKGEPRGLQGIRPIRAGGARVLEAPPSPPRAPEAGFYLPKVESLRDGVARDY